mmetsp:Transcript_55914/g.147821  ORF Transcript_55914/g.147821 Transcript_55914/m.147821 type:complete len:301 (+) Transcript_55914:179-1081(+)
MARSIGARANGREGHWDLNINRQHSDSLPASPAARNRSETDSEWELVPRSQGNAAFEPNHPIADILQKAGDWLQWGYEGAMKGVEKTRDGVTALMDYRRLKQQHKEALEQASRQHWALLELEAKRRREQERARQEEAVRQADLARELLVVEKVKREKLEAEQAWRSRFDALVSASEANESLALAKQAEVELLRKEAERRAEMERDALRALAELRARQQAQQAAEEESARRLRDLEEEYQREVTSLRERLMQLEREVPPPPRADDLPDEYYCAITMVCRRPPRPHQPLLLRQFPLRPPRSS